MNFKIIEGHSNWLNWIESFFPIKSIDLSIKVKNIFINLKYKSILFYDLICLKLCLDKTSEEEEAEKSQLSNKTGNGKEIKNNKSK